MAILRTFTNHIDAEIAMSALEAAGIESVIVGDDCGGVQPALGMSSGIRIEVNDEDLDRAVEVLDAPAEDAPEADESGDGDLDE